MSRQNLSPNVSRRAFLTGGVALGATAAVGALAGCAPAQSSTEALSQTGVMSAESDQPTWEFEVPPEPIPDDQIVETIDAGILVIGAGPSGFATALSALDAGAKDVVVIAKSPTWNALGGSMHAYNTKTLKEIGHELTPDEISKELRDEWRNQANRSDHDKWVHAAYASEEALNWLIDYVEAEGYSTSLEVGPQDESGVHQTGPGSHSFMGDGAYGTQMISGGGIAIALAIMEERITQKGGRISYNTTAEQLVREGDNAGRVVAAIAKNENGDYVRYNASDGIVLCTGCITWNDDMVAKFSPEAYEIIKAGGARLAGSTNTGDGTRMALWVGAAPQRNWPWACEYNTPLLYMSSDDATMFFGAKPYMNFPALAVNQLGKRYMNEDCSMSMAVCPQIKQPGMVSYSIWTPSLADAIAPFEQFGRWYMPGNEECPWGAFDAETTQQLWDAGLGEGGGMTPLENAKFNTLEELADYFDLPLETLQDTISTYNDHCNKGYDSEFAKRSELLVPISSDGPFYVSKNIPTIFCVYGGPRCDVNARVLDYDDQPIEGLFEVGGIMMGDLYQTNYSYLFPGANMGFFNITYGYLTGKALAEGRL